MSPHRQDPRFRTREKPCRRPTKCRRHRRPESRCLRTEEQQRQQSTAPRPSSARAATSGKHPGTRSLVTLHRQPILHRARRRRCSRDTPPGRSALSNSRGVAGHLTLLKHHRGAVAPSPRSVEVGRVSRLPRPPSGLLPLVSRKLTRRSRLLPITVTRRPAPRCEAAARPASTRTARARRSASGVARGPHLPQQSAAPST